MIKGENDPATREDEREAVNMGVALSTQLISAAFALMGIIGGFITYVIQNRSSVWTFIVFLSGMLLYGCSIYQGSIGITVARNNGFLGLWKLKVSKKYFNRQSIFLAIGTLLLITTIFLTKTDDQSLLNEQRRSNDLLERNLVIVDSIAYVNYQFTQQLHELEAKLDSLESMQICFKRR